jgi:hypothetical protein
MSTGKQLLNLRGTLCLHLHSPARNPKRQKSSKDGNSYKMMVATYQLAFYDIPQDIILPLFIHQHKKDTPQNSKCKKKIYIPWQLSAWDF